MRTRPAQDTGIGLHLSANVGDTRHHNADTLRADHDLWQRMGVRWLKVVTAGDSQLHNVTAYARLGYEVIVRFWSDRPHPDYVPADDMMRRFGEAGARYAEGGNEADHSDEQSRFCTPDDLAVQYVKFADNCARAGLVPIVYSFEGDRLERWLLPMVRRIVALGRRDALDGSVFGIHNRPGRMPIDSPPVDATHGGVGFVWRSYEEWDRQLAALLGHPVVILGTEAGREPSETNDDVVRMAQDNVAIVQATWLPSLWCQCFWLWQPGGMGDGVAWVDNRRFASPLPVVQHFVDMPKPVRTSPRPPAEPPVTPPPPAAPDPDDAARRAADRRMEQHAWGEKYAYRHGLIPFGGEIAVEYERRLHYTQPAFRLADGTAVLIVFAAGEYTDAQTRVIEWRVR